MKMLVPLYAFARYLSCLQLISCFPELCFLTSSIGLLSFL